MNVTNIAARPTVESARDLGIFSEVANGRIRVWGPLAEVKRWWALAGCDLIEQTYKPGLAPGQASKVDAWHAMIDDNVVGYVQSLVEEMPMFRCQDGTWSASNDGAPVDAPRGRMAYGFTAA